MRRKLLLCHCGAGDGAKINIECVLMIPVREMPVINTVQMFVGIIIEIKQIAYMLLAQSVQIRSRYELCTENAGNARKKMKIDMEISQPYRSEIRTLIHSLEHIHTFITTCHLIVTNGIPLKNQPAA